MWKPDEIYVYRDEQGHPLFEVGRWELDEVIDLDTGHVGRDKFFRERSPGGEWERHVRVRRVLYRLPELLDAIERRETIFVVEGEKDVESLRIAGLAATTSSGPREWKDEYASPLSATDVVIIPDEDEGGRQYAAKVACSLKSVAHFIWILSLPGLAESQDVSDWLKGGRNRYDLLALLGRTRSR